MKTLTDSILINAILEIDKNLKKVNTLIDDAEAVLKPMWKSLTEAENDSSVSEEEYSIMLANFTREDDQKVLLIELKNTYKTMESLIGQLGEGLDFINENSKKVGLE